MIFGQKLSILPTVQCVVGGSLDQSYFSLKATLVTYILDQHFSLNHEDLLTNDTS